MPGGSTTTQQQQQQSQTNPWAPAQPLLSSVLGGISSAYPSVATPNATQTAGATGLVNAAQSAPNFSAPATSAVNSLLSGGPTNYSPILTNAYSNLQSELTPYASGSMVGKNPALQGELGVMSNDITNQIGSQFAAAGRSFSPGEGQAIARGVTQGEAPVIAGQYNTDVANQLAAAQGLNTAAGNTASGLTGITQTQLGNEQAGLNATSAIPGILNQPANMLLSAGNTLQSLPLTGLSQLESLINPIASLGGQSSGSTTGSTTQNQSLVSTLLGGVLGGAGILGGTGAFGSSGWLAPAASGAASGIGGALSSMLPFLGLSDERTKTDIERVGILNDNQPVYKFRYRGDPSKRVHIGLLAQEVEDVMPDAVHEIGGVKFVDYGRATERAAA